MNLYICTREDLDAKWADDIFVQELVACDTPEEAPACTMLGTDHTQISVQLVGTALPGAVRGSIMQVFKSA